jgi:chemotaxis protein methyltransferase CheR
MNSSEPEIPDEDIKLFLQTIKLRSNYDFSNYSLKSLKRRIFKIMSDTGLNISEIRSKIQDDKEFMVKVVKNLTINTTELFRDPKVWRSILYDILPLYLNRGSIKVWHPGCSTGEEVYSLMIILSKLGILEKSEIYASDINNDVLNVASEGKYKYSFNQHFIDNFNSVINTDKDLKEIIPCTSHENYFNVNKVYDVIKMNAFLKEKPFYKVIDLVKDENLFNTTFDLIICRNVIIYFNYELQNKVLDLFYKNLNKNGCLVLGLHESIMGPYESRFDKKNLAYFRKNE